jgi:N-acetyl-1-D-myo-inositol-2-amino-2-deoxy-alpha-D-glucopyranoside deacetylase
VLFVHAHPDDESISTGGTIATLVQRGAHVTVVTCTRGERGEVIDPALAGLEGDHAALAAVRVNELTEALRALGASEHRFLGAVGARSPGRAPLRYKDSGMEWGLTATGVPVAIASDYTDAEAFSVVNHDELVADLAAVIEEVAPQIVVSYNDNGGYGHPDHVKAHYVARAAALAYGIPFFVIESADATEPHIMDVDVTAVADKKRAALVAYRTQLLVRDNEFVSPGGQIEVIAMTERFRRIRPAPLEGWKDSSLPTRIATVAVAFVVGALAGTILTVAHQASVLVGTIALPWGIIAAVIITAALLSGLRIVFETRMVAGFAVLGLLGAAALLALQSPGGSILVPANPAGYVWTFAPVIIAAIVLAWPRVASPLQPVHRAARGTIETPAAKGPDPL